ncbi:poly(A)-binding protein binding protein [Elasticomyces elasticus]|nr:poly(A)-binding protein binding protein [Elasticomyces elasticus]
MSHGFLEPEWPSERRPSKYEWWELPQQIQHSGKQATHISLAKRRKGAHEFWSPELFVCKWYSTRARPNGIQGAKYVYNEYKTLSGVQHPNVVRYEDFYYDPTGARMAVIFMEYCDGGDLSQFVNSRPDQGDNRLEYRETVQVFNQIAQALLYLHHGVYKFDSNMRLATFVESEPEAEIVDTGLGWQAILHRDIKPANVFVSQRTNDGIKIKLGDFGIAKFETDGTDTYVGSRDFLAPEQRTATVGGRRTTFKSDIYALAVTIRKVSKLSDRLNDYDASLESSQVDGLLLRCCEDDDTSRPTSAVIVDKLLPLVSDIDSTMAQNAFNRILEWEIGDSAGFNLKLAWQPAELVELLRRLLAAGSEPLESTPDRAIIYFNEQLENLEHAVVPPAGSSRCSVAKMSLILDVISILNSHGASGRMQQYKLSALDYSTLQASPATQLRPILLRTLQTKIAPSGVHTKEAIMREIQTNLSYEDILMLRYFTPIDAFKLFASKEKLRVRQEQGLKRAGARQPKNVKLQDLKKFAADFKLTSRVPDDLLPILANDQYKQIGIRRKGEEAARDAESRGIKEQTDDERMKRLESLPTPPYVQYPYMPQHQYQKGQVRPNAEAANALREAHETSTVSLRDVETPLVVRTPPAKATEKLPQAPPMPARTWATIAASGARPTSSPLAPTPAPVFGITPTVARPQRAPPQAPGIPRIPRRLPRGSQGPERKGVVEGDRNRRA